VIRLLTAAALLLSIAAPARADELVLRGNYYRDRNTRVIQPEADVSKELPTGTLVGASYLLDAITSASVAAGVTSDKPFTELRNEFGVRLGQRFGRGLLTAHYSYSSESDYTAHLVSLSGALDLYKKNTTLGLAVAYGNDTVGKRLGPVLAIKGGLETVHLIGSLSQVLNRWLLLNLNYDLDIVGFGSVDNGYQANPYRQANMGGANSDEKVPYQRIRQQATANLNLLIPIRSPLVPYLAFRPAFRFYWDDWTVLGSTTELRAFLPVGPVEFRLTGRYYQQRAASFWSDLGDGKPFYKAGSGGKFCQYCLASSSHGVKFYTSDPKLSEFQTMFLELRLLFRLNGLRRLSAWLSEGLIELSYGHYFNDRYAHDAFGDAEIAGVTFSFPL
jgi:hypothetical protein